MSTNPLRLAPVDWFNFYGSLNIIFNGIRNCHLITDTECAVATPENPDPNKTTFKDTGHTISVLRENPYFPLNSIISKFMLLCAVRFGGDKSQCYSFIEFELIGETIPYIRVKCDYYKVIQKEDRYGTNQTQLVPWKKDEIKQDHSKTLLQSIPKFDDYIISPDNVNYHPTIKNCYNLYSEFPHKPHPDPVTEKDIPVTWNFLNHIFNAGTPDRPELDMGLTYLKVLYEHPKQILPILCLISKPRNTGKTTFNNWLGMMFGNNYVSISPEALTKQFNSNYATKNIITFEEAFIEIKAAIEKLKHLNTAKTIDVSQKFISEYSIPFYGKFILYSNKVLDFMRIDEEEIRFWIRPIPVIKGKRNTKIEDQLFAEIPKFLRYLLQLPPINFDNGSRMVLDEKRLENEALLAIKNESRSGLFKEIDLLITEFFDQNEAVKKFYASATDIKDRWFKGNNQISNVYIFKTLKDEAGLNPCRSHSGKSIKYYAFEDMVNPYNHKTGTPFEFFRLNEPD